MLFVRRVGFVFGLTAVLAVPAARAQDEQACPRAGTLGVSRTVEIDTTGGPGFGTANYKAYDFLQDKEVILTFDDGPQRQTTEAVLKALADECVKATFFSVGKMALEYPQIIREVSRAGHTVGTHTWNHKSIPKLKTPEEAQDEIERGVSAVHRAVGGPIAPFFRFPTLADSPEAVAYLGTRNIAMFSTDIDSFDFRRQTAEHLAKTLMQKVDKRGKGILLMHDIHKVTAKAVPMILADLKARGYKVVHMTAKAPVVTLEKYDQEIEKDTKGLPQVGAERPVSSIVKTIEGAEPPKPAAASGGKPQDLAPARPDSLTNKGSAAAAPPAEAAPALPTFPALPSREPAAHSVPDKQSAASPMTSVADNAAHSSPPLPPAPAAPATGSLASDSAAPPSAPEAPSPVKTVGGEGDQIAAANAPAAPIMPIETAPEAPQAPPKSISQRVKEAWEYWFGQ